MKNGFTLIEMLAVIVILAAISLLIIPAVASLIKQSKDNAYNQQIEFIIETSDRWIADHISDYGSNVNSVNCISISDLKKSGYFNDKVIKDPRSNDEISGFVKVSYNSYKVLKKEYVLTCTVE